MLRQALQNFIHIVVRDALQRWFSMYRQEIERGLKIQTSLVIRSVLMQASTHTVLLRAFSIAGTPKHPSLEPVVRIRLRNTPPESLCVQLKVQRADRRSFFGENDRLRECCCICLSRSQRGYGRIEVRSRLSHRLHTEMSAHIAHNVRALPFDDPFSGGQAPRTSADMCDHDTHHGLVSMDRDAAHHSDLANTLRAPAICAQDQGDRQAAYGLDFFFSKLYRNKMTALVLLFWALPAFWPSGTFQGKVSYGPINQRVTVKTDKSAVGTGEITLRGFINARDDFASAMILSVQNELAENQSGDHALRIRHW